MVNDAVTNLYISLLIVTTCDPQLSSPEIS
jgi:hypothetical protein